MRFYLDTSVFGGFFDAEFQADTQRLFDEIAGGKFSVVISELTAQELLGSPDPVRTF